MTNEDIREALQDFVVRPVYNVKRFLAELDYLEDHSWLKQFYELVSSLKAEGVIGEKNDANSYIAWAVGITQSQPYDLEESVKPVINGSMPDVDIDFEPRKRNLVFNYIQSKYGGYRIGTFSEQSDKAVVRMVARTFEVSPSKIDELSKSIETLEEIDTTQDPTLEKIVNYSKVYRGLNGGLGTHAAGVVATKMPMPIRIDRNGDPVTQYDKKALELLNAVKFDILNVAYIDVIADMFNLTKNNYHTIDYEDASVYSSMLQSTVGVFQLESDGMRNLLTSIKPENFEELAAILALFRPGPIKAGLTDYYARGKRGEEVNPIPSVFAGILGKTYNVLVYQEQIIEICKLVGYTPTEADSFRKKIGSVRADTQHELERFLLDARQEFEAKAAAHQVDVAYISSDGRRHSYYDVIEQMAGYSFNKSHAVSYARISYICAYFKLYHPTIYALCLLNVFPDKLDDLINESRIKFLPPDVNRSKDVLVQEGQDLRLPLSFIKGCGASVVEAIMEAQPFSSEQDFKNRLCAKGNVKVRSNIYKLLSEYGALESLGIKGTQSIPALRRASMIPYFKKYTNWEETVQGGDCYICGEVASVNLTKTSSGKDSCRIQLRGVGDFLLIVMSYGSGGKTKLEELKNTINVGRTLVAKGKKLDDSRKFILGRPDQIKLLNV